MLVAGGNCAVDEIAGFVRIGSWVPWTPAILGVSFDTAFFQRLPNMDVIPEPVEKWTNLNGTDLLDLLTGRDLLLDLDLREVLLIRFSVTFTAAGTMRLV